MTPQEEIRKQLEYNNLIAWHEAGYTGKGVNVWNTEDPNSSDGHAEMVTNRIKHAAPDCNVFVAGLSMGSDSKEVKYVYCTYQGKQYNAEDFIKEFKIKIITNSVHGSNAVGTPKSKFWNELKDKYNLIFFSLAGNKGSSDIGGVLPPDVAIYVGACVIADSGAIRKASYSSIGEELDFVNFTGNYIGTSHAGPYAAGMATLLIQKYGDLTQNEVYEYFKFHAKDLDKQGLDINTGWGVPIMGDPNEDIGGDKEVDVTETNIKVNGQIKTVRRILFRGENYIRLRDFEDVLNVVDVEYDAANKLPVVED